MYHYRKPYVAPLPLEPAGVWCHPSLAMLGDQTRPQPAQTVSPYPQTQHTISHSERDHSQRLTSVDGWGHRGEGGQWQRERLRVARLRVAGHNECIGKRAIVLAVDENPEALGAASHRSAAGRGLAVGC